MLFLGAGRSLSPSTHYFIPFQQGIACNFTRTDNVIRSPTETWPFPSAPGNMTRQDDFFQGNTKQFRFSADEFHSIFDFKARTEKQLMLEKTLLHLEILKENDKIILLKCILCLLYCIRASADLFFPFKIAHIENCNCSVGPFKPERLILHYASKTWFIWKQK